MKARDRVCNANVLSFNGETTPYRPFKWMNNKKLTQQPVQTLDEGNDDDPSYLCCFLGVGILSNFLSSAILGGHLIDTTPFIGMKVAKKGADDLTKMKLLHSQLEALKKNYPVFTKIHFDGQCFMRFFYQICTLAEELGDMKVLKREVVVQFEDASEYLRSLGVWDAIYFMEVNQNKKKKEHKK